MTKLVIGIAGRSGVGKNTFADMLTERLTEEGFKVTQFAFADPVKSIYSVMFPGDPYTSDRYLKEKQIIPNSGNRTMRRLLQIIGTEFGRRLIHPRIWVNHLRDRVWQLSTKQREVAVIVDLRFTDELETTAGDMRGIVYDLHRFEPKPIGFFSRLLRRITFSGPHASENVKYREHTHRLGVTAVYNENSLQDLRRKADMLVRNEVLPKFNALLAKEQQ